MSNLRKPGRLSKRPECGAVERLSEVRLRAPSPSDHCLGFDYRQESDAYHDDGDDKCPQLRGFAVRTRWCYSEVAAGVSYGQLYHLWVGITRRDRFGCRRRAEETRMARPPRQERAIGRRPHTWSASPVPVLKKAVPSWAVPRSRDRLLAPARSRPYRAADSAHVAAVGRQDIDLL